MRNMFYFLGAIIFSLNLTASSAAPLTTTLSPTSKTATKEEDAAVNKLRKRGSKFWYAFCHQIGLNDDHRSLFIQRFSDAVDRSSRIFLCLRFGEPSYEPQMVAQVIDYWLNDWILTRMERNLNKRVQVYGYFSDHLGLEPKYHLLSLRLLKIRKIMDKKWELFRAAIPSTINRLEEALDEIAQSVEFKGFDDFFTSDKADLQTKLSAQQKGGTISFKEDDKTNLYFKVENRTVIGQEIQRTHSPFVLWFELKKSAALSADKTLFQKFSKAIHDKKPLLNQSPVKLSSPKAMP